MAAIAMAMPPNEAMFAAAAFPGGVVLAAGGAVPDPVGVLPPEVTDAVELEKVPLLVGTVPLGAPVVGTTMETLLEGPGITTVTLPEGPGTTRVSLPLGTGITTMSLPDGLGTTTMNCSAAELPLNWGCMGSFTHLQWWGRRWSSLGSPT